MTGADGRPGRIVAVHRDDRHRFSKPTVAAIALRTGLGVEGDAHFGETVQHLSRLRRDPGAPNLRQVHLMHAELIDELAEAGFDVAPGVMGENLTTRGVDLLALPNGTVLAVGDDALVEITGLRNPCRQLERHSRGLQQAVLDRAADGRLVRRAGVMGVVRRDGIVQSGDVIELRLPDVPHRPSNRSDLT